MILHFIAVFVCFWWVTGYRYITVNANLLAYLQKDLFYMKRHSVEDGRRNRCYARDRLTDRTLFRASAAYSGEII